MTKELSHRHGLERRNVGIKNMDLRLIHFLIYSCRVLSRLVVWPACWLPQGPLKHAIRLFLLNFQNSLPTELAVNNGDVVVQVGTPWPPTLQRLRKTCGPDGKVVILEVERTKFERLTRTAKESGYDNMSVVQTAAWSETKRGVLQLSPYPGEHNVATDGVTIDNDFRVGNRDMATIECDFRRLDDTLRELNLTAINYLSVTVNGAELEVLKGARDILAASPNVRIFAKGHSRLKSGEYLNTAIVGFLSDLGFSTKITRGEPSSTRNRDWRWRSGDVYAWK